MNMISTLRQQVREHGDATITLDEFNQLQAEWITRTQMEELSAQPLTQRFIDQIVADREAIKFLEERGKALGAERIEWETHEKSGRTGSCWRGNTLLAVTVVLRDQLNWSIFTGKEIE